MNVVLFCALKGQNRHRQRLFGQSTESYFSRILTLKLTVTTNCSVISNASPVCPYASCFFVFSCLIVREQEEHRGIERTPSRTYSICLERSHLPFLKNLRTVFNRTRKDSFRYRNKRNIPNQENANRFVFCSSLACRRKMDYARIS